MNENHNRQTGILEQIGIEFLGNKGDINNLLSSVFNIFTSHYHIERGMINIYNQDDDSIEADVYQGYSNEEVKKGVYRPGEGIIGTVFKTGKPTIIMDIKSEPRFLNRTGARNKGGDDKVSFICVPVLLDGSVIGTISVDMINNDGRDLNEEFHVLTTIAIMIAQFLKSRIDIIENERKLRQENEALRKKLSGSSVQGKIIGRSKVMRQVYEKILLVSETDTTVLITGESGTGKELIADAIHNNSRRKDGPFVKVNIAALPKNLIESELFGYEKGAFTGADRTKKGKFEAACGGTIFLDEIGDLDVSLQVHLLRVLQQKSFERVGGTETIPLDVRVIAATHQDLEEKIKNRQFREDLYYRLNVFPVYAPELRSRKTDIILLADHFLELYSLRFGKEIKRISTDAINLLASYHWPGNVRELENCMERAVVMCNEEVIRNYHLPPSLQIADNKTEIKGNLEEMTMMFEKELIIDSLKVTRGNISMAAESLWTTKRILNYKINKMGIDYREFRKNYTDRYAEK